jgi:mannose/fructose/N-acetylgalactosamine-specific phosphotransferase system component IID
MSNNTAVASKERQLPKNEFWKIFWRSFTLLASFNSERMEGLGYEYALMPSLKRIWADDEEGYKQALHRHMAAFNMTVAPSPFVMGISVAMEEMAHDDPTFDRDSINAVKVSLMGPLSGIGDTFFWGIFKVIACSLGASFAAQGSVLGPLVLLITYNIPGFLTRYYSLKIGYSQGSAWLTQMETSGMMRLFTYCAGIVGVASIGCLTASWVGITCPLTFTLEGSEIVIQDYLDQICPQLLSLIAVLLFYSRLRANKSVINVLLWGAAIAFVLGAFGIIGS